MSVQTVALANETVQGIALVGQIVTFPGSPGQYKVHSVEGRNWYAFDDQGSTKVDLDMTVASWITEPLANIIPVGHKIGEGFAQTVRVGMIKRGVNLKKGF